MIEVADTSVLILARRTPAVGRWLREHGDPVAIPEIVALEYLMGARSGADYLALEEALDAFIRLAIEPSDWTRARDVHRALAASGPGHQRSVRIPDLLIAAVAERHAATLVHFDADYDRIAAITGQPVRWVVPRDAVSG